MLSKIRTKLVVFFITLILAMSIVNYLVYLQYSSFVHNLKALDNIVEDINKTQSDLANDIVLTRFVPRNFDSQVSSNKLINDMDNAIYLNLMDPSEYAIYRSIQEMVKSYTDEATKAINAKLGRDPEKSLMHFNNSEKIAGYMKERIDKLVSSYRVGLVQKMQNQYILVITLFATGIISLFFSIVFSERITRHIKNLTKVAQIVSNGKFDIEEIPITGKDEISILTSAFNTMISNIKKLISEIKEKAEVEKKLKQKEVENLEINNLLKEAELRALQSQINPHFLFNTLGCVAHTALKEEADKTYDLIMSVADLFRYNLSRSHGYVTLRDEINNIKEYINIQKARFKDKFEFDIMVEDDSLLDVTIPCLSIQPIVENSFLHGIEKKEGPGIVKISIFRDEKDIVVEIWDTGVGISEERIREIMSDDPLHDSSTSAGHTTKLGLKNVIKRLKLFYQRSDVMEIRSKVGESTSVILYIPAEMG